MPEPTRTTRLPALDGLRGLAALCVLCFHVVYTTGPGLLQPVATPGVRFTLAELGVNGVDCFFVLSGFLVGGPFAAWLAGRRRPVDLRRYVRSRVLRIYPAWWACLAIVAVVSDPSVLRDLRSLLLLATLQHSYDPTLLRHVVPPAWTLVIEVSFYVAAPLCALALLPFLRGRGLRTRAVAVGTALLGVAAAAIVCRGLWLASPPHPDLRPLTFSLPIYADSFALGALAALVLAVRPRLVPARAALAAGVVVFGGCEQFVRSDHAIAARPFVAIACALVVLGLAAGPTTLPARLLATRPFRELGRLSYAVYLWHLPLLYAAVRTGLVHHGATGETLPALAGVLGASLLAAQCSWWLVERPALRLIGSAAHAREAGAGAAAAR
jgi:peptidoglycan/LPS O-acetylase OafA/YrhL